MRNEVSRFTTHVQWKLNIESAANQEAGESYQFQAFFTGLYDGIIWEFHNFAGYSVILDSIYDFLKII